MSNFISNAFMLPNDLIDKGYMALMKGPALACYLFIARKTRGWNKSTDSISVSQLVEGTGYNKDSVLKGCEKLVELGIVVRKSFTNQPAKYELTDSIFAVDILDSENIAVESLDSAVESLDSTHSKKSTHNNNYKTTNTKTNINRPEESKSVSEKSEKTKADKFDFKSTLIKNGVSEKTATEFMQVRKAKGGVNTERAFKLLESQIAKANLTFAQGIEYCLNRQKPWAAFEAQWYFNEQNRTSQPQAQQPSERRRFGSQANQPAPMRDVQGECA
ncbi:replication protein [Acinetobacter johnsonii]|uniref:replication protein n=1 Tax=Acinetobacter johnsonii TaxID=40214 RepID=UPI00191FC270|nr:replication protein [Acinetobacter johnsonii]QQV08742.1 replication protein [Acinetobacter johnsonii]